jgi:hypothetical protein
MSLIVLDAEFNYNSVTYSANSVIEVDPAVSTWLVSLTKARAIVAGPAEWAAGSYAANNLVTHNGTYYVNNANAVSSDVPGNSAKWVQVAYLGTLTVNNGQVVVSNGRLLIKGDDGNFRQLTSVAVDGNQAPAIDPTVVIP